MATKEFFKNATLNKGNLDKLNGRLGYAMDYPGEITRESINAEAGKIYFMSNSVAQVTVTFPANPKEGDQIKVHVMENTGGGAGTIINGNGNNVDGFPTMEVNAGGCYHGVWLEGAWWTLLLQ